MLCRHAQLVTVGQSSTHCRSYHEREDALAELYALPKREFREPHQAGCQSAHVGVNLFWVEFMFSCSLEASSLIQFYVGSVCVRCSFIVCDRVPSCLLCIPVSLLIFSHFGERHGSIATGLIMEAQGTVIRAYSSTSEPLF